MRAAILTLTLAGLAAAHEVPVHLAITQAAMKYLLGKLPEAKRAQLAQCAPRITSLLLVGTQQEDDAFGNRYMFHFTPQLNDFDLVSANCTSIAWAFSTDVAYPTWSIPCRHNLWVNNPLSPQPVYDDDDVRAIPIGDRILEMQNKHTWAAAVGEPDFDEGWRHLGYVLHLLQDLTSPAHTRSDAHPREDPFGLVTIDPDPLETAEYLHLERFTAPISGPDLIMKADAIEYFAELQKLVQGRFFSKDTILKEATADRDRLQNPDVSFIDGEGYVRDSKKRPVAYVPDMSKVESRRDQGQSDPDIVKDLAATRDVVIDAENMPGIQWRELRELAVLYTASLINKYWETRPGQMLCNPEPHSVVCHAFQAKVIDSGSSGGDPQFKAPRPDDSIFGTYKFDPSTEPPPGPPRSPGSSTSYCFSGDPAGNGDLNLLLGAAMLSGLAVPNSCNLTMSVMHDTARNVDQFRLGGSTISPNNIVFTMNLSGSSDLLGAAGPPAIPPALAHATENSVSINWSGGALPDGGMTGTGGTGFLRGIVTLLQTCTPEQARY